MTTLFEQPTKPATPTPGSPAAMLNGCRCAVDLNRRGEGVAAPDGVTRWWHVNGACPVHGTGSGWKA